MLIPCALSVFDPKVGQLENMPKWWSKDTRTRYMARVEQVIKRWSGNMETTQPRAEASSIAPAAPRKQGTIFEKMLSAQSK